MSIEDLQKVLDKEQHIEKFRKNFKRLFVVVVALGPGLTIVGLAFKALGAVFGGLNMALIPIVKTLKLLFFGILANPIIFVPIAALIAAVGALFIAFKTNFLGIADLFKTLERSMAQFSGVHLALKEAFSAILSGDICQ